ncbi:hypothetical protein [Qingshengfaniella alkalisoli]|uniref:hypothetical protein n=1 Tax=Qingshengfaniella alkalisoli TaxID=2599296 RepID=UPI00143D08B4|nr:hypothetical protein [Qingshengfaniella alkalisoli]
MTDEELDRLFRGDRETLDGTIPQDLLGRIIGDADRESKMRRAARKRWRSVERVSWPMGLAASLAAGLWIGASQFGYSGSGSDLLLRNDLAYEIGYYLPQVAGYLSGY